MRKQTLYELGVVLMTEPFRNIYKKKHSTEWKRERQRKDAFVWKIGIFAMTLISMVGIAAIWWATTL